MWRSGCVTISSGPLPSLPVWAMASMQLLEWVLGGMERQAGMCTYYIYLLLLLCCIISLGAQTARYLMTHEVRMYNSLLFSPPHVACVGNGYQSTWLVSGFFCGSRGKYFLLSCYSFQWAPVLLLDTWAPNEPWNSGCIAISYCLFPFLSLQTVILKTFGVFLSLGDWEGTKGWVYPF